MVLLLAQGELLLLANSLFIVKPDLSHYTYCFPSGHLLPENYGVRQGQQMLWHKNDIKYPTNESAEFPSET